MAQAHAMLLGTPLTELVGRCRRCATVHHLPLRSAGAVEVLEAWFTALSSPSSSSPSSSSPSSSSSSPLMPLSPAALTAAGGKMLAVLLGRRRHSGEAVVRYAVSGDLLGVGDVDGCVPSIIRREDTAALEAETLETVRALTAEMAAAPSSSVRQALRAQRRAASRRLMTAMNTAVRLADRRGRLQALPDVFVGQGIPSGTADCALPKLLHDANVHGVDVVGVAEAWWGPPERGIAQVGERRHGLLAAPCERRCVPILGALLCEADDG